MAAENANKVLFCKSLVTPDFWETIQNVITAT